MKRIAVVFGLIFMFAATVVLASNLDGTYNFVSRIKNNKPDLVGWTGTMKIGNGVIERNIKSPDGKDTRFYVTEVKTVGPNTYSLKMTKAYKPEYIGEVKEYKIFKEGNQVTLTSSDGTYKEVWKR